MDYIGIKPFDADGTPAGEIRIVGLFTSTAYTRSAAQHSRICAARSTPCSQPPASTADSHAGKALLNVLETIRATSCSRSTRNAQALRARDPRSSTSDRACACSARRPRSTASSRCLVYVPRERYDRAVRGRIGECPRRRLLGGVSALLPRFPEGAAGARAVHHRRVAPGPAPPVDRRDARARARRHRCARGGPPARRAARPRTRQPRAHALANAIRTPFRPRYQRSQPAGRPGVGDIGIAAAHGDGQLRRRLPADAGKSRAHLRLLRHGAPLPLSERVPMLENFGFRVIDERLLSHRPAGRRSALAPRHGAGDAGTARPIDRGTRGAARGIAFPRCSRARPTTTVSTGSSLPASRTGARRVLRACAATCGSSASPSQDYLARDAAPPCRTRARLWSSCSTAGSIPVAAADRRGAREATRSSGASTRRSQASQSLDEDRILRAFLTLVHAIVRTNFFQTTRTAAPPARLQARQRQGRRACPAAARVRDLRLSPHVEGVHLRFGRSRAAASAGRTGRRTSAPRCSAW